MIRKYQAEDFAAWVRMRSALWPEIEAEHAEADAHEWLARKNAAVFVAERPDGKGLGGFVVVGEREFADGCDTAPVAYLEGWYVVAELRGQGLGRGLVEAAVQWARDQGYREMGSDALLENVESQRAHEAVGFAEVERAVRYRRVL